MDPSTFCKTEDFSISFSLIIWSQRWSYNSNGAFSSRSLNMILCCSWLLEFPGGVSFVIGTIHCKCCICLKVTSQGPKVCFSRKHMHNCVSGIYCFQERLRPRIHHNGTNTSNRVHQSVKSSYSDNYLQLKWYCYFYGFVLWRLNHWNTRTGQVDVRHILILFDISLNFGYSQPFWVKDGCRRFDRIMDIMVSNLRRTFKNMWACRFPHFSQILKNYVW